MKIKRLSLFVLLSLFVAGLLSALPAHLSPTTGSASAACLATAPPTTYGQVKQTVTVATAGTYRVWSRIKAPDTTANSYYFQTDTGACAYNVGDSASIPANAWTWVNYQDGSTATPINVTLTAGSHTFIYTAKEANVQLDKVMLLTDTACVPTSLGDNCAVNDTTSPAVSITSPAAGSTATGNVTINASATDASGVAKVEFYIDNALVSTDTTSAYSFLWNSANATNGAHTLFAKAYDTNGNVGTSTSVSVTANNSTVTPTPTPTPTPAPASGDVNGDGRVNALDLSSLISHDGQNFPAADFNKDGTIGAADMAILLSKWTW